MPQKYAKSSKKKVWESASKVETYKTEFMLVWTKTVKLHFEILTTEN